jgi:SAM-dependent methyltransferase
MDWQERITRETPPAIRVEHDLRYALAAPLVQGAPAWLDLGCGAGVAAADALAGEGAGRAVLVDADGDAAAEAARAVPAGEAVPLVADLSEDEGLAAVREALGDARDGVATCFEVIEHLQRFTGVVELLVELAEERGFTVLLSVPNDAFWPVESPWHATMWGEGSFEELRRLLPADHVVARQVPLQGSAIVLDGAPPAAPGEVAAREDAVPSHFIAAFGPRAGDLAAGAAVSQVDLAAQRRWERTREANLAFYEERINWAMREFREWRGYMNQLEGQLGREPTTTPLDFP